MEDRTVSETKQTPTPDRPWVIEGPNSFWGPQGYDILTHDRLLIATVWQNAGQNQRPQAEFVLTACNCHDELVEVCKELLACVCAEPWAERARAILAKAKDSP